jgi:hypothetical protein
LRQGHQQLIFFVICDVQSETPAVSLDKQTDRQTDRQTNENERIARANRKVCWWVGLWMRTAYGGGPPALELIEVCVLLSVVKIVRRGLDLVWIGCVGPRQLKIWTRAERDTCRMDSF